MACNASKAPLMRVIAKRGYSANVCPRPLGSTAEVATTTLGNKVVVASAESALPVSRVSVVFRAGSRNESYGNQGSSHMLRIASGLTTQKASGFLITRQIQQVGGNLTVSGDRELVAYTIETTSDHVDNALNLLEKAIQPAFKPWELQDSLARIKTHAADVPPQVRAVELLHKAAFRTGLGNSVYIPKFQIGKLSSETLLHYVANNCTASRCAVVGVGVDQNMLSGFAQSLELAGGEGGKAEKATLAGGDARKDTPGNIAHVAVAGQGGALASQKETLAFAVLQQAVGAGAVTKRGSINGSFGKALAGVAGDAWASYAPLNASYSDAGLFGFIVSTDAQRIGKAVEALTRALKAGAVTDADVKRGKAVLKAYVLESYGTDSALIAEMGVQAALTGKVLSADELIAAIDAITLQDVQEAAKKAGSSKLSVGAVGNLAHVPYASDLA